MTDIHQVSFLSKIKTLKPGDEVRVNGWLHNKRDHGKLLFIEIRDRDGAMQCVCDSQSIVEILGNTNLESVISVTGTLQQRNKNSCDLDQYEILVKSIEITSESEDIPFEINKDIAINEEIRHLYRTLYLRRPRMMNNIIKRSKIIDFMRSYMSKLDFLEIHTPILGCPSPEGARDFVVPSRAYPGNFYALPQAPQIFKQLLMASGVGRYFQVAPCFRDEDSRADRLRGEFYQLDIEASFVDQRFIIDTIQTLVANLFKEFKPPSYTINEDFRTFTYEMSMQIFGTDKPDLRNPLILTKLGHIFNKNPPEAFENSIARDGATIGITIPDGLSITPELEEKCRKIVLRNNGPGLAYIKYINGAFIGSITNSFTKYHKNNLERILEEGNGMFIMAMYPAQRAYEVMSTLRDFLGNELGLVEENVYEFCWITDFPMYKQDSEGNMQFSHNPFSKPKNESPNAYQYDLVCNGYEIASGAERNISRESIIQGFEKIGYKRQKIERSFNSLLSAFKFGVPPHAGIALGIERIIMLLQNEKSLREVCAFPLMSGGNHPLFNAPKPISTSQMHELCLSHTKSNNLEHINTPAVHQKEDIFSDITTDENKSSGGIFE